MELTHVYLDEFGNSNLDVSKQGASSHFIIAAILVPESKVKALESGVERVRKQEFQSGEMKSSSVGKNHIRRARILQKLAKLDFNILLLVIDKHKLSSQSGLKYKTSFYKFLYQRIYEHLRSNISRLRLHNDGMGSREFLNGFVEYAKKRNPNPSLFDEFDITFEDSKSNVTIQLADFIAGSLARNIDKSVYDKNCNIDFAAIIKNHMFPVLYYPRTFNEFLSNTEFSEDEDREIAEICYRKAYNYIVTHQRSDDEIEAQRTAILNYLLFRAINNPMRDYILTKELIGHLSRIGYNEMNKTTFRNKIIAGLRDEGVVIASSKSGYKIPTKIREINDFINHSKSILMPMLNRVKICDEVLRLGTLDNIQILDTPENMSLKALLSVMVSKN